MVAITEAQDITKMTLVELNNALQMHEAQIFHAEGTEGATFRIHDEAKVEVVKPRFETSGRGFTRGLGCRRGSDRGRGRGYGHGDRFNKEASNANAPNGEQRPQ